MKHEITKAKSIERLEFLRWVIKEDIENGCDWTREIDLDELRSEWSKRKEVLTNSTQMVQLSKSNATQSRVNHDHHRQSKAVQQMQRVEASNK